VEIAAFSLEILSGMMTDSDRLKDLGKKLDKSLEERRGASGPDSQEGSAAGLAIRAVSELLVGLLVMMGLGWGADKYLGTAPWIMLALMPVGLAAGVVNVMRLSRSKQAEDLLGGKGETPPSVKDDDDED
jgi:ATP synthase protein I